MTDWPEQRIQPPDPAGHDPRQREVHDMIASGPRGEVPGPLAVWLHRPEMADRAQSLGRYCRYDTLLPQRLSELAIITMARIWGSEYEWYVHKKFALEAGIAPEAVEAIRTGNIPHFPREDEAVVHAFVIAAQVERTVDDALYARAVAALGSNGVIDLVGILGYYTLISLSINIFKVSPPAGAPREFS